MFFVQKRKRLKHGLLIIFEKFAKIMHFSDLIKKTFENPVKNAQQIVFVVKTSEKLEHALLDSLKYMLK